MKLADLCEPFAPNEIEWRIGQAGTNDRGVWAKVLAYVTNRAIMQRLDSVCGPENWKNEYRPGFSEGAVLCGISIKVGDEWVTKWDGAENTDVEAVKGGLSNAMKRAAVQWGIGRYLYELEEGWAKIGQEGEHYVPKNDKKGTPAFRWSPPTLPAWARPGFEGTKGDAPAPAPAAKKGAKVAERATSLDDPNIMPTGDYAGQPLAAVPTKELQALAAWCEKKDARKYALRITAIDTEVAKRNASKTDEQRVAAMHEAASKDEKNLELLQTG